jgi:tetratricopeptide (TPR) repeat protein
MELSRYRIKTVSIALLAVSVVLYIFLLNYNGELAIRPNNQVSDPILRPALIAFADAVDANTNNAKARMELGMTYEGAGMNEYAEATYKQYAAQFPDRVIGWYRLAIVQQNQGKIEEAIKSLLKGADLAGPKMDSPHWQLAFWYIDIGDLEKASIQIGIAHAKKPNSMQVKIAKGRIALAEENPSEAIAILDNDRLIASVPDGYVYQLLGRAYRALGDEEKSRIAWSRAGQKKPNWADPWINLVVEHVTGLNAMRQEIMQLLRSKNVTDARTRINEYFTYDKENRVVRRLDAKCNSLEGKMAKALNKYNRLILEDSTDRASIVLLAKLRMQITKFQTQEEIEITKALLETVLAISPEHAQAKLLLDMLPKE